MSLRLLVFDEYFAIAGIGRAHHSFYFMVDSFIQLFYLLQIVQNILSKNLMNIRPTMTITIKLNKQLIFRVDDASTQVDSLSALRVIKPPTIFVCTWDRDSNIGSTLVARILGFFSIDSVDMLDFSFFEVILELWMPKTTGKMDEIFLLV